MCGVWIGVFSVWYELPKARPVRILNTKHQIRNTLQIMAYKLFYEFTDIKIARSNKDGDIK